MRIALVTNAFPRTGEDYYGIFVWELASFLAARGHELHVVTSKRAGTSNTQTLRGIPVHRFPYWGWKADRRPGELGRRPLSLLSYVVSGTRLLARVVREQRIDLIHAYWLMPSGLIGVLASKLTLCPIVATAPGTDLNVLPRTLIPRTLLRFVLPRLNGLIAEGTPLRSTAVALGARANRSHVVLGDGGIDRVLFHAPAESPDQHQILFVGGLTPPKRLDTILRAMPAVLRACPQAKLRVVGGGPMLGAWRELASELSLNDAVTFAGPRAHERVADELRRASLLVLCSDNEGLPSAIMEALTCGVPVVATRVGGIPDLVADGENGFLVDRDDVASVARQISAVISDRDLRARLSVQAQAFALRNLGRDAVLDQVETIYRRSVSIPALAVTA